MFYRGVLLWLTKFYCIMSLGDKMKLTKRDKILYLVTLILIIGGDQFTKHLVSSSMQLGQSQEINR